MRDWRKCSWRGPGLEQVWTLGPGPAEEWTWTCYLGPGLAISGPGPGHFGSGLVRTWVCRVLGQSMYISSTGQHHEGLWNGFLKRKWCPTLFMFFGQKSHPQSLTKFREGSSNSQKVSKFHMKSHIKKGGYVCTGMAKDKLWQFHDKTLSFCFECCIMPKGTHANIDFDKFDLVFNSILKASSAVPQSLSWTLQNSSTKQITKIRFFQLCFGINLFLSKSYLISLPISPFYLWNNYISGTPTSPPWFTSWLSQSMKSNQPPWIWRQCMQVTSLGCKQQTWNEDLDRLKYP